MNERLPKITLSCYSWPKESINAFQELMRKTTELFAQEEILPATLQEIQVTEDFAGAYKTIAEKFNLGTELTRESEFRSVIKLCENHQPDNPQQVLLVDTAIFGASDWVYLLRSTLLKACASSFLPEELRDESYTPDSTLQHMAKIYFVVLFSSYYAEIKLAPPNSENYPSQLGASQLLSPFKRNVKRIHMRYQATLNWNECVIRYYDELNRFLIRYTENFMYSHDQEGLGVFRQPLTDFGVGMVEQVLNIMRKEPYSLEFLEKTIQEISALCFFEIQKSGKIRVMETPKKLFPDLIDTHDRIVGFVDILGFKNMIRDFDANRDIALLTNLKEALDHAITQMKTIFKQTSDELEFKLFSDCLCISLPYFDNETDFTYQFGSLMLGIKVYQTHLLQKGYLVRGGISAGSYYSNDSMIFSGALVDAYEFERTGSTSKTPKVFKPPRVLVSPQILSKLEGTKIHYSMYPYFVEGFIRDKDGEVFINPVLSISESRKIFESVVDAYSGKEGDALSDYFSSMISGLANLFIPMMNDTAEQGTYHVLISILEDKIQQYQLTPFVDKYAWTKELLEWLRDRHNDETFSMHMIKFQEVLIEWS